LRETSLTLPLHTFQFRIALFQRFQGRTYGKRGNSPSRTRTEVVRIRTWSDNPNNSWQTQYYQWVRTLAFYNIQSSSGIHFTYNYTNGEPWRA
jgi:hypothetical protein